MGFFKRMAGILGFVREGLHGGADDEEEGAAEDGGRKAKDVPRRGMKGFGDTVSVDGDRPSLGPVLIPCNLGEGGVQGLRWYARQFLIDEDGDAADEFLNEISLPENQITQTQTAAKFEINFSTKPAAIRKQTISTDGNIHQIMMYQGRTEWV
ncbi:hypothetical protein J5N97_029471 [Dioscorea zingiberensis]|uniref:Uncharacterized protein n=1 Tax=Dioscorea zingiberensis TaxID=325984 RepID=A0A9D5C0Z7_9LILI|nr:hypothetical protein J5N97_029471 [Dioscorea zingiberensis]